MNRSRTIGEYCPLAMARHCAGGMLLGIALLAIAPAGDQVADNVSREIDALLQRLDDAQFSIRALAAQRLEELVAEPGLRVHLAGRFRRALAEPEVSFEVRSRLEQLLRRLPTPAVDKQAPAVDTAGIAQVLDRLGSDSYVERDSSARRLIALLDHAELIAPVWLALKQRLADPELSTAGRRVLEPLADRARKAWLLADPAQVPLPRPPIQAIQQWIDDVVRLDEMQPEHHDRRTLAHRELTDLIVRDDTREEVLEMLRTRLAAEGESTPHSPLQDLVDLARPAMVAEVWRNHALQTVQYLIVGVPQINDTAVPPRATHFDQIDEQSAHCVSGNSLTPGDYPVRVAIPHPEPGHGTMFYLTNLPTPRRRAAYEYHIRQDEALLLAEITERTLDHFLARRMPLEENEILLLAQLDPRGVSRRIGDYFRMVPNASLVSTPNGLNDQSTVYGGICAVLSRVGTADAVPSLEQLARSGVLGKPSFENRLDVAWVAALAIAQRDPWPKVDEWLASLLDERSPLTADPDQPPEVGASAAGLLLDRRGVSVRPFGLHTAGEAATETFHFVGYRFESPRDREDVKRWWLKQQALEGAAAARGSRAPRGSQPGQ